MREIAGIPEVIIISQYAGKHLKNFKTELFDAFSPSSGEKLQIPSLRKYFKYDGNDYRVSIHYTNTKKAVLVACKNKLYHGYSERTWGYLHEFVMPLYDPDGIKKVEDYISSLLIDPSAKCENRCCIY